MSKCGLLWGLVLLREVWRRILRGRWEEGVDRGRMGSEGSGQGCWVVRWGNLRMMAWGVGRGREGREGGRDLA